MTIEKNKGLRKFELPQEIEVKTYARCIFDASLLRWRGQKEYGIPTNNTETFGIDPLNQSPTSSDAAAPHASELPTVASLWIRGALGWLEHMCLSTFVSQGHPVVLYHYGEVSNVPDGVTARDARGIWAPTDPLMKQTAPSYIADIFRIYLMQHTDEIWIDTDVIAQAPLLPDEEGFVVGFTPWNAEVNNCIMRLPKTSETLGRLVDLVEDLSIVPPWMRPALRQRLEKMPVEDRAVGRYNTLRTIIGPRALTYHLKSSGEVTQAQAAEVLSPVPWQYVDVLFNPYGGWQGWFSDDTVAIHLWSNVLRQHKKMEPHQDSFIGAKMKQLGLQYAKKTS